MGVEKGNRPEIFRQGRDKKINHLEVFDGEKKKQNRIAG